MGSQGASPSAHLSCLWMKRLSCRASSSAVSDTAGRCVCARETAATQHNSRAYLICMLGLRSDVVELKNRNTFTFDALVSRLVAIDPDLGVMISTVFHDIFS
uniref:Chemosensory protein 12 n=1 Tax=Mythimna separata TaxID=271217 RepID=A0A1V1WBX0_MYTSE